MAKQQSFEVGGTQPYRGVAPGKSFKADPEDPAIQRALDRGSIKKASTKKSADTKAVDDRDRKE